MNELDFIVDKCKCVKCGLCKEDCIAGVIDMDSDGFPYSKDFEHCIKCQHCLAVCPNGAIKIFNKNPDYSFICNQLPNADSIEHLIKSRRSCRQFKQENVDSEVILKLKDIVNWAPTGVNFRDLHFTFVENMDTMQEIREEIYKILIPVLKFVPIPSKFKKYKNAIINGKDIIFRNAPHMVVVASNKSAPCKDIDPIIALSYMELYAQSMDLGTLWCGLAYSTLQMSKKIMRKLNIPKTHKLSYVMLFGYPKFKYKRSVQPDNYVITSI